MAVPASFFGPIITEACRCPGSAPTLGCALSTGQNLMNLAVSFAAILAVILIVYSGILFMTTAANPEGHSKARSLLINVVIGFAILMSAWLIVDFVMKSFYNPSSYGPWNSILLDAGSQCTVAKENSTLFTGSIFVVPGTTNGGSSGTGKNCPAADPSAMVGYPAEATDGSGETGWPSTVQSFLAMRAAALKDGVDLKVTDGFRSDAEQVQLWDRYNHDTSQVAKPCSLGGGGSNHNSGKAVDIAVGCSKTNSNCNTAAYRWLKAHGAQWGFRNALPNDVVHWSPSGR
jgi:hypothetical protein